MKKIINKTAVLIILFVCCNNPRPRPSVAFKEAQNEEIALVQVLSFGTGAQDGSGNMLKTNNYYFLTADGKLVPPSDEDGLPQEQVSIERYILSQKHIKNLQVDTLTIHQMGGEYVHLNIFEKIY